MEGLSLRAHPWCLMAIVARWVQGDTRGRAVSSGEEERECKKGLHSFITTTTSSERAHRLYLASFGSHNRHTNYIKHTDQHTHDCTRSTVALPESGSHLGPVDRERQSDGGVEVSARDVAGGIDRHHHRTSKPKSDRQGSNGCTGVLHRRHDGATTTDNHASPDSFRDTFLHQRRFAFLVCPPVSDKRMKDTKKKTSIRVLV
jgi:hypothetical protein